MIGAPDDPTEPGLLFEPTGAGVPGWFLPDQRQSRSQRMIGSKWWHRSSAVRTVLAAWDVSGSSSGPLIATGRTLRGRAQSRSGWHESNSPASMRGASDRVSRTRYRSPVYGSRPRRRHFCQLPGEELMTPEHRALVEARAAAGHPESRFLLSILRRREAGTHRQATTAEILARVAE